MSSNDIPNNSLEHMIDDRSKDINAYRQSYEKTQQQYDYYLSMCKYLEELIAEEAHVRQQIDITKRALVESLDANRIAGLSIIEDDSQIDKYRKQKHIQQLS